MLLPSLSLFLTRTHALHAYTHLWPRAHSTAPFIITCVFRRQVEERCSELNQLNKIREEIC